MTSGDANPTDLYIYSIFNSAVPSKIFGRHLSPPSTTYSEIPILTPQIVWCSLTSSSITYSANFTINSYRF